jgi:hypothetical protein
MAGWLMAAAAVGKEWGWWMSRPGGSNGSWLLLLAGALAAVGCESDSDDKRAVEVPVEGTDAGSREDAATSDAGSLAGETRRAGATSSHGHLVVVTERESPEDSLHYLHVLETWPEDGKLDYANAIELGAFPNVYALGDAVFVHLPEDGTVRKLVVKADGTIGEDTSISFAGQGANGVSGDMIWVSETRAYFLDEASAQFIAWNPQKMEVEGSFDLDSAVLKRGELPAQISRGIARDGRGFVSVSWRDWDTLEYYDSAAIGVFDAKSLEPKLEVIEDDRCASNVTTPFEGNDGYVYLMSDAALGFDALANPKRTEKALCVLRMKPGSKELDKDFFVDLKEVLESPGFYAAHPMKDGKLLVNMWAPDVEVSSVATADDPSWYWNYPPFFEYAIVDLERKTSIRVPDLGRAAVQWSVTIRVDNETYVQTYRDDEGSDLKRVDTDGSVTTVLSNGRGTDVQYVGRVSK